MVGQYGFCHSLLDELPEFDERSLEAMRQPLEDHIVTISRASGTLTFPANFQLIAAMNPCPCGYWGDPTHNCSCSPSMVTRYQKRTNAGGLKVSGPRRSETAPEAIQRIG